MLAPATEAGAINSGGELKICYTPRLADTILVERQCVSYSALVWNLAKYGLAMVGQPEPIVRISCFL